MQMLKGTFYRMEGFGTMEMHLSLVFAKGNNMRGIPHRLLQRSEGERAVLGHVVFSDREGNLSFEFLW